MDPLLEKIYAIETTSKNPAYHYGKMIFYIDPEYWQVNLKECFDVKMELWKVQTNYGCMASGIAGARIGSMMDLQADHATRRHRQRHTAAVSRLITERARTLAPIRLGFARAASAVRIIITTHTRDRLFDHFRIDLKAAVHGTAEGFRLHHAEAQIARAGFRHGIVIPTAIAALAALDQL